MILLRVKGGVHKRRSEKVNKCGRLPNMGGWGVLGRFPRDKKQNPLKRTKMALNGCKKRPNLEGGPKEVL